MRRHCGQCAILICVRLRRLDRVNARNAQFIRLFLVLLNSRHTYYLPTIGKTRALATIDDDKEKTPTTQTAAKFA